MIVQRNYANFYSGKCDCCKRVRKVRTKLEIVDENGALYGEMTICPNCLKQFNLQEKNNIAGLEEIEVLEDEEMDIEDFTKLGYEVKQL